jgi:predicted LPLAT superfamily acyltransferase
MAVLTQQLPTESGAAMSTRLTCGCGVLLVASHLGGLSVEKTFERQVAAGEASKERAAEPRRRCKAGKA